MIEQRTSSLGTEALWRPTINQGLVRFLTVSPGVSEPERDCRGYGVERTVAAVARALAL